MIVMLMALEFLCGSLMFSYWLGLLAKKNIRELGDGNPGAANLIQQAGVPLGFLGIVLDFSKGFLPLFFLIRTGLISGWALVPIAIAPVFGHVFSPFVGLKGGKGISVSFGIWSAVLFEASLAYAVILALILIIVKLLRRQKPITPQIDGLMVMSGMFALGIYLALRRFAYPILALCLLNFLLFLLVNRAKLLALLRASSMQKAQEEANTLKE